MAKKYNKNATSVAREALAKHPRMSAQKIADKYDISASVVYRVRQETKNPLREGLQELLNVQENAPRPTESQLSENRLMFTLGVGVGVVLTMFLLFLHQQGVL